jgi:phage gp36-like protein
MAFPPYTPDYVTDDLVPVAITLTSEAEIQRVLGYKGVKLHLDDLDDLDENYLDGTDTDATDENYIEEAIQQASSEVLGYLVPRFDAELLSVNPIIRRIATYWAAHNISRRRGNEPLYETEVAEGIEKLERYREGSLYLNVPSRGPRAITQSYVTDMRFYHNPTRVIRLASTSIVPSQKLAWNFPFFWL